MVNKKYQKKNFKNNKNQKNNKPQHNRSEKLSTSIGDILKSKGMIIPSAEKEDNKTEEPVDTITKLKNEGIDLSKVPVSINMKEPEPEIRDSTLTELKNAFYGNPDENKKENPVIHLNADYITMDGSDKMVETSKFITKNDNQ